MTRMRHLTYYVAASIDGLIAGPDGEFDMFVFHGDLAAWIIEEYPETLPVHARAALGLADAPPRRFDTVLMGRKTFEPALHAGMSSAYPHLRQIVFSRTLPADQADVEVVATDPIDTVRALKEEPGGGLWLCGGAALATALRDDIDEMIIKRNPVVLGRGVPLFNDAYRVSTMRLAETRVFDVGVVVERYTAA